MLLIMDATLSICCCLLSNRSMDVSATSEKIKYFLQLMSMLTSDPANQEPLWSGGWTSEDIFSSAATNHSFFLFQVM